MTLTIALSLCRGGSPKGPAGNIEFVLKYKNDMKTI